MTNTHKIQRFDTVFRKLTSGHKNIPVIIFCDPGVDDALMLLQMLRQKKFPIAGIIPVRGNASSKTCLENTLALCEYVNRTDVKIYPGKKETFKGTKVYGKFGLNGLILPKPKIMKAESVTGIRFATDFIKNNKTIIISTAGLTEPAEVLKVLEKNSPRTLKNIIGISMMGGVINITQEANFPVKGKRYTEANVADNPAATKALFDITQRYNIPIFLSTLDLTHSILVSKSDINALQTTKTPFAQCVYRLIYNVPKHYKNRFGKGPDLYFRQPIHDVHASCCLIWPEMYLGQWKSKNIFLLSLPHIFRKRFIETLS